MILYLHGCVIVSADALNRAGLEASIRPQRETQHANKWPSATTLACDLLLALSLLKYVYPPCGWLALCAVVIGSPKVLFRAIASIRTLSLSLSQYQHSRSIGR